MSARSWSFGIVPASVLSSALRIIMNRIVGSPSMPRRHCHGVLLSRRTDRREIDRCEAATVSFVGVSELARESIRRKSMLVRKVCTWSFALIVASATARAQTSTPARYAPADAEVQLVRRAALDYLEGFYEGDTTKLVRSVSPN